MTSKPTNLNSLTEITSWLKYTYKTDDLSLTASFDLIKRETGARYTGNVKVTGKTCGRHSCTVKGTT